MDERSANELVTKHLFLVETIVHRERRKLGTDKATTEEMSSFAKEGLVIAANSFDESRGVPFVSYAKMKMRWRIYDGLCELGWFPRRMRRNINFYRRADEMLRSHSDTPPPKDKVEAVHRLSDRLKELATAYVTTYAAEEEKEPATVPPEAEDNLERKRFSRRIRTYVDSLPPKESLVIRRYFFEERKLIDIAKELSLSTSWTPRHLQSGHTTLARSLTAQPDFEHCLPSPPP